MRNSLFGIGQELLETFNNLEVDDESGEILNIEILDQVATSFENKATNIGLYIQELLGLALRAIKLKKQALNARQQAITNKANRLKDYLCQNLILTGKTKLENESIRLSFRKSESVEIISEDKIPDELFTIKTTKTPNKTAIKAELKAGKEIEGVFLKENQNLQIK